MPADDDILQWTVPEEAAGERMDKYLASHLGCPRNRAQRWLKEGRVERDGKSPKASDPVLAGQRLIVRPPTLSVESQIIAETGELRILHEDEHLAVVDKPAGIAVHPGAGRPTGTLVHRLLGRYPEIQQIGGPGRPGIVHRLDLDTTGVMVIARTDAAYLGLSKAFAERRVQKTYNAIAHGHLRQNLTLDHPIGRHPQDRKRMAVRSDGRPAVSHVRPLAVVESVASAVEIDLETGRTHQIRVHMKAAKHPLVGDPVYGEARWKGAPPRFRKTLERFPRPALHARCLRFRHPVTDLDLDLEAPVPEDLLSLWQKLSGGPWPESSDL